MKRLLIFLLLLAPIVGYSQSLSRTFIGSPSGMEYNTRIGGYSVTKWMKVPRVLLTLPASDSAGGGQIAFDSANTRTMWYHNGTQWVQFGSGGGGSGTVTSITAGYGLNGGTITTSGTIRVDTTRIPTRRMLDSVANEIPTVNDYVPYTGATGNVDLGAYNLSTDTITGYGSAGLHLHGDATKTGIHITEFGNLRFDLYPTVIAGDSVLTTNSLGFLQRYDLKSKLANYATTVALSDTAAAIRGAIPSTSGFVPYTGATTNLNMGNNSITAKRVNADTLEPNSSAGLHLHNTSHQDIFIAGAGGGQNLTIYAPTSYVLMANSSETDTVLGTNSSGLLKKIGIGTTYLKKADTASLSARINAKGNGTVTSVGATGGTGISVSGSPITSAGTFTVTNTAPDQTVSLTGAGSVSVTGTYPTFTVTGTGGSGGVAAITSTGSTMQVTGTTTVNVEVDTTHPFTFTANNTFTRDITVDSASIGTGNGLSTNIRFGRSAFPSGTTATGIVALGESAANKITTGQNDIYIGRNAGANTGVNVAGHVAMGTGNLNYSTGDNNVALGFNTMAKGSAWSGLANVGVGINSGNVMTTATANSWLGSGCAAALTSGGSNTFLGVSSGSAMTTGSNNVLLGGYTGNVGGLDIRTLSNRLVLSDGAGNIRAYHNATNWLIGTVTDGSTGALQISGSLGLNTAGNKLNIATGSNASVGTGTLSSGTVTINTTAVTASSIIQLQLTSCSSCGTIYVGTVTAGTSFVVTSTNGSDASTFNYIIIN
jgi:hypothetical protein